MKIEYNEKYVSPMLPTPDELIDTNGCITQESVRALCRMWPVIMLRLRAVFNIV
jgi:hypothetical protein